MVVRNPELASHASQELAEQYPIWLERHKDSGNPDLTRYRTQLGAINKVCSHFAEDSKDFKRLIELMQEVRFFFCVFPLRLCFLSSV